MGHMWPDGYRTTANANDLRIGLRNVRLRRHMMPDVWFWFFGFYIILVCTYIHMYVYVYMLDKKKSVM